MADDALIARQTLAQSLGLDKEVVDKRYGVLRPAWNQEWLGKLADDAEEAVPALGGMLDAIWGQKPKQECHEPVWWGHERPRPHRGKSADPAAAEAASNKVKAQMAAEAQKSAGAAEAAAEANDEAAEDKKNLQEKKEANFAVVETQKRRLSFFGRPVQKFRLAKLAQEMTRKAHEHQAALWAHVLSDAETERKLHEGIEKGEIVKKNKAASSAAAYRAEERGARAAAAGFKPMGAQLKSAMKQAMEAEAKYRRLAEVQEDISRRAKLAQEVAHEFVQRVRE